MENLIKFIKIDVVVQMVLLGLVVITGIFIFPLMITLPVLGGWQLFSASVIYFRLRDKVREKYLIFSVLYLGFLFMSYAIADNSRSNFFEFLFPLLFILVPFGIAIWYYVKTNNIRTELEEKGIIEVPTMMNNILDSEEIFKPIKK